MGDDRVQDAKGRVKEAVGDMTDNEDLENKGKMDQAKASVKRAAGDAQEKAKEKAGDAIDAVKDKVDDARK
jgi:uncharacterized protein YjbJ (UPF0337 family)